VAREDLPIPAFTGVRVLEDFPLATLRDFMIGRRSSTPGAERHLSRILEHEQHGAQARQIFTEANALLDVMIEKNLITRVVYTASFRQRRGDDIELYPDCTRAEVLERFHFLRSNQAGRRACRSLADFIAPKETGLPDHIGAFAVTSGIGLKNCATGSGRARRLQRDHGRSRR